MVVAVLLCRAAGRTGKTAVPHSRAPRPSQEGGAGPATQRGTPLAGTAGRGNTALLVYFRLSFPLDINRPYKSNRVSVMEMETLSLTNIGRGEV